MLTASELSEVRKYEPKNFVPLSYDEIPTHLKYVKKRTSKNIHIGQRKLLMSEIYFLTKYGELSDCVVYAGAAGGQHIPFLSTLFPKLKFYLWDPAPFAIEGNEFIDINNGRFTDEIAASYLDKRPLFICDIRSGSDAMKFTEFENEVHRNNQMQRRWIELMKPKMAMLKFRVPYNTPTSNEYDYLDGEVCLQTWAPPFSGETRLITDGSATKIYREYEAKMHYINTIIRPHVKYNAVLLPEDFQRVANISRSFDCSYEIYIWYCYIDKNNGRNKSKWIADQMIHACKILHRGLRNDFSKK